MRKTLSWGLVPLSQNHIVHLVNVFICAGTSWSAAALTSVHCAHVSELFEQPVCNRVARKYCSYILYNLFRHGDACL